MRSALHGLGGGDEIADVVVEIDVPQRIRWIGNRRITENDRANIRRLVGQVALLARDCVFRLADDVVDGARSRRRIAVR
jgi:hypothetical protein